MRNKFCTYASRNYYLFSPKLLLHTQHEGFHFNPYQRIEFPNYPFQCQQAALYRTISLFAGGCWCSGCSGCSGRECADDWVKAGSRGIGDGDGVGFGGSVYEMENQFTRVPEEEKRMSVSSSARICWDTNAEVSDKINYSLLQHRLYVCMFIVYVKGFAYFVVCQRVFHFPLFFSFSCFLMVSEYSCCIWCGWIFNF